MRPIKFRAWDKIRNEMCEPFTLDDIWYSIDDDGLHFGLKGNEAIAFTISERYDIEQFTGLQDKNGKDIYEGDILRYDAEGYVGRYPMKVVWHNGGFWTQTIATSEIRAHLTREDMEGIEVIGNIHENPELLK